MPQKNAEHDLMTKLYGPDPTDSVQHTADTRDLTFVPDPEDEAFLFGGVEGADDVLITVTAVG